MEKYRNLNLQQEGIEPSQILEVQYSFFMEV